MSDRLINAIDEINKLYGSSTLFRTGGKTKLEVEAISTNSSNIDRAIGIGGIPKRKITLISGPESSGKSLLALNVIKSVQQQGGIGVYLDAEYALTDSWLTKLGIINDALLISQSSNAVKNFSLLIGRKIDKNKSERIGSLLQNQNLLKAGLSVIVLDSLDALIPPSSDSGGEEDAEMARYLTFALTRIVSLLARVNVALIIICQQRIRFGSQGSYMSISGGQALKNAATVWLELECVPNSIVYDEKQNAVQQELSLFVRKNRVATPFSKAHFIVDYTKGIIEDKIDIREN